MLSVSTFMANTLNSIIKSAMCFLPCLKVSIFYLASVALLLSLNVVFISLTNSSQSWISSSSSIWSNFFRYKCLLYMLQIKDLRVDQWEEPCIGLTQENLIENSIQDCLFYILILNGPCKLFLAYPKWPCVRLKVNICFTHCMTSFFQNLLHSSMCHVTCDCVIWCDLLYDSVILSL